jgi:hypothetical protein
VLPRKRGSRETADPLGQTYLLHEVHQRRKYRLGGVGSTGFGEQPQRGPDVNRVEDFDRMGRFGGNRWIDLHQILEVELPLHQRLWPHQRMVGHRRPLRQATRAAQ